MVRDYEEMQVVLDQCLVGYNTRRRIRAAV